MKILSIGNSFSQDAHAYLHKLGFAQGLDVDAYNLYIGGCSLERHYNNIVGNIADYDYQKNGRYLRKISIEEALGKKKWDYITPGPTSTALRYMHSMAHVLNSCKSATTTRCLEMRNLCVASRSE